MLKRPLQIDLNLAECFSPNCCLKWAENILPISQESTIMTPSWFRKRIKLWFLHLLAITWKNLVFSSISLSYWIWDLCFQYTSSCIWISFNLSCRIWSLCFSKEKNLLVSLMTSRVSISCSIARFLSLMEPKVNLAQCHRRVLTLVIFLERIKAPNS